MTTINTDNRRRTTIPLADPDRTYTAERDAYGRITLTPAVVVADWDSVIDAVPGLRTDLQHIVHDDRTAPAPTRRRG